MTSQTSQQTVIEPQKLQELQDEIQQEMHEIVNNASFGKILKKYGISRQEVLQFQYTLDLTKLESSDTDEEKQTPQSLIAPNRKQLCICTCWSNDLHRYVDCPCR